MTMFSSLVTTGIKEGIPYCHEVVNNLYRAEHNRKKTGKNICFSAALEPTSPLWSFGNWTVFPGFRVNSEISPSCDIRLTSGKKHCRFSQKDFH